MLSSGHSVAGSRLKSNLTKVDHITEQMGGLSAYQKLKAINIDDDSEWNTCHEHLTALQKNIVNQSNVVINLTSDAIGITAAESCVASFVERLPQRTAPTDSSATLGAFVWDPHAKEHLNEGFGVASQVNYVVQGGLLNLKQKDSSDGGSDGSEGDVSLGSASVISRYLRNTWLWDEVRVKGGAYGGFCSFDGVSNVFSYGSYRDPNLTKTLEIYSQSPHFLKTIPLDVNEVTKGIVGTISDADTPRTPSGRGYTDMLRYLVGETDDNRQRWRDEVLNTKEIDFRNFGERLQMFHDQKPKVVVIGGTDSVDEMKNDVDWSVKRV